MLRSRKNIIPAFYFAVLHFNMYKAYTYNILSEEVKLKPQLNEKVNVIRFFTKYVCYVTLVKGLFKKYGCLKLPVLDHLLPVHSCWFYMYPLLPQCTFALVSYPHSQKKFRNAYDA